MVDVIKSGVKAKIARTKWLLFTTLTGILMLLIPISFLFMDPIMIWIRYGLMLDRVEGPRVYLTLFNFTNAQDYVNGKAEKMKLEEVGPFVFQEYRINEDLVIDEKRNLVTYTPKVWTEFIPQESIADPKDLYITMPSISMLQAVNMISKYPYLVRNMFNIISSSIHAKAIVSVTAHEYLWGYPEPLIKVANTVVPGLFYINSSGVMARIYDEGAKYTMELRTRESEKFSINKVTKFLQTRDGSANVISLTKFTNANEGAIFHPNMMAETPFTIFRHGVCRTIKFQYTGTKTTEYGSEAFTYDVANDAMNAHDLCLEDGKWCPDGLINLGPCFFNVPFAISRGHFLGADPRILERFEGLKPDEKLDSTEIVIDPNIGVTLSSTVAMQLNLVLRDMEFNAETKRFKDTVLPLCLIKLKHPKLPPIATTAFLLLYTYGPYIKLVTTALFLLVGTMLLVYSAKIWYWRRIALRRTKVYKTRLAQKFNDAYFPLVK